jgi:hypothetical protein
MQTTRRLGTAVILIAVAMAVSMVVTAPADANTGHTYSSNSGPCPHWSIQNVLDDPDSDWDGDRVSNVDEVYVAGGLDPCKHDSAKFCGLQPQYCYNYTSTDYYYDSYYYGYYGYYDPYYHGGVYYEPYGDYYYVYVPKVATTCAGGHWTWSQVNAHPYGDWDGDGVSNYTEAINGADPCVAPCPTAYYVDVNLNPYGDWDHDGRSNQYEVHVGSNPCVAHTYHYTYTHTYTQSTPQQLPHVGGPGATGVNSYDPCPAGYPYYHPQNGQCYANPIKPWG